MFLLRAYRTTLARFGHAEPIDTAAMRVERRVSATYKDLPGGQVLGPTFDYTHRLLDAALAGEDGSRGGRCRRSRRTGVRRSRSPIRRRHRVAAAAIAPRERATVSEGGQRRGRRSARRRGEGREGEVRDGDRGAREGDEGLAPPIGVAELLEREGLVETERPSPDGAEGEPPGDLTRTPLAFPTTRDLRLQALARGDEGFLLALAYSTQRGYGRTHPFVGEIRIGHVELELDVPELGFAVRLGEIRVTECQMINQFLGSATTSPRFTRGYGLVFGQAERKAMAMALVERALRAEELGEEVRAPAQDEEFVLAHADNVQASGFVEHLKLPHHVDFQAELELLRRLCAEFEAQGGGVAGEETAAAAERASADRAAAERAEDGVPDDERRDAPTEPAS